MQTGNIFKNIHADIFHYVYFDSRSHHAFHVSRKVRQEHKADNGYTHKHQGIQRTAFDHCGNEMIIKQRTKISGRKFECRIRRNSGINFLIEKNFEQRLRQPEISGTENCTQKRENNKLQKTWPDAGRILQYSEIDLHLIKTRKAAGEYSTVKLVNLWTYYC